MRKERLSFKKHSKGENIGSAAMAIWLSIYMFYPFDSRPSVVEQRYTEVRNFFQNQVLK